MALTKVSTGMLSADLASVDLNIDANTLYIDVSNNRVGINNTGPATALDVTGNVSADEVIASSIISSSSTNPRLRLFETDTTDLNTQLQNQAGDFNISRLDDDASDSTLQFKIDHATGNVSIPNGDLDVTGTLVSDGLTVDTTNATPNTFSDNVGAVIDLKDTAGATDEKIVRLFAAAQNLFISNRNDDLSNKGNRVQIANNGDISFYDTSANQAFFWDASAASLGIGTTSPSTVLGATSLEVSNATGSEVIVFRDDGSTGADDFCGGFAIGNRDASGTPNHYAGMWANTDTFGQMTLKFAGGRSKYEAGTPDMVIDIDGNVGIGETDPNQKLHVVDTSNPASDGTVIIESRRDGGANVLALRARDASAPTVGLPPSQGPVMRFQGFNGTDFSDMAFIYAASGAAFTDGDAPSDLIFGTTPDNTETPTEAMRIDSSGNLKVGYTGTGTPGNGNTDTGHLLKSDGRFFASSASNSQFNRNSDGDILTFRESGDSVGSIGVDNNDNFYIGATTSGHSGFYFGNGSAAPMAAGTRVDNAIDLGTSTHRFKALWLRTVDGTAAINTTVATAINYNAASFTNNGGTECGRILVNDAGTTQYITSSDQRLKENIAAADDAGSKIDAIQVRKFDWISDGSHQDYGMIAQELQVVAPEAVAGDADSEKVMGVDYSKLVPMLVKEIQSLRARVAQLES